MRRATAARAKQSNDQRTVYGNTAIDARSGAYSVRNSDYSGWFDCVHCTDSGLILYIIARTVYGWRSSLGFVTSAGIRG